MSTLLDSKGRSLALIWYPCLIHFVWCRVLALRGGGCMSQCTWHPLPIPRGPSCPHARQNIFECWGGKRSKISPEVHWTFKDPLPAGLRGWLKLVLQARCPVGRELSVVARSPPEVHLTASRRYRAEYLSPRYSDIFFRDRYSEIGGICQIISGRYRGLAELPELLLCIRSHCFYGRSLLPL
jgi:hypothetical protein